jgi:hypothetical protein
MLPNRNNDSPPVRLIAKLSTSIFSGLATFATFAGHVYLFFLLNLPSHYAARASTSAIPSTSAQAPEGILQSLSMHWQILSVASALIIPSVHVFYFLNRYKTISPPPPWSQYYSRNLPAPGCFCSHRCAYCRIHFSGMRLCRHGVQLSPHPVLRLFTSGQRRPYPY